jgi:hypothetical protein
MRKSQTNVDSSACASSATVEHWDQINWKRCERQVTRLQARIVKASRDGCWSKVKALQRLLTCSFSGKALAVKRVTENKGKRTSGVDQVLWSRRSPNSERSHRYSAGDTARCRYGGCISQNPTANSVSNFCRKAMRRSGFLKAI